MENEKFFAEIKSVGNSKMVIVPHNIIKGRNWNDGIKVEVFIREQKEE